MEMPESVQRVIWDELGQSARLVPADLTGALGIVEGILKQGEEWGATGIVAATKIYRSYIYRFMGREEEADSFFREAEAMIPEITNQYDLMRVMDSVAMEYIRRDDPTTGLDLLKRSEEIIHTLNRRSMLKGNYHSQAIGYFKLGVFEEALEYNLRTLRLQEEFPTYHNSAIMTTINIGSVYGKLRDYAMGEEYYRRAITMIREANDDNSDNISTCLLNIGALHNLSGRYREAMPYLQEAFDLWMKLNDKMCAAEVLAELGLASLHLDDLEGASKYFRRAWDLCNEAVVQGIIPAFILRGMGQVHQRKGELREALDHYLRSLEICQQMALPEEELEAHVLLADLYPQLDDYRSAYQHQQKVIALRQQIIGAERQRAVAASELRDARFAAEREREMLNLRAEKAEQEADFKSRELGMMALQMTRWNSTFRALRQSVEQYAREGRGQTRAVASSVLRSISTAVESNPGWHVFEEQFERVHREFITRLRKRCNRLTSMELRICVLIRMGLSTRQIADALFASELTVKKHRTNIRKKLNLQRDENLNGLLLSL